MKPYLVHQTWVDLDSVISIGPYCPEGRSNAICHVAGQFHNGLITIDLGSNHFYESYDPVKFRWDPLVRRPVYDAFVEAWKGRATIRLINTSVENAHS